MYVYFHAGLSGRIQASRITLLLAPHGCSLSPLVNLMSAARKSQTTIIGGSVGVTVGESEASLSACRSLIGRISQVLTRVRPLSTAVESNHTCSVDKDGISVP